MGFHVICRVADRDSDVVFEQTKSAFGRIGTNEECIWEVWNMVRGLATLDPGYRGLR